MQTKSPSKQNRLGWGTLKMADYPRLLLRGRGCGGRRGGVLLHRLGRRRGCGGRRVGLLHLVVVLVLRSGIGSLSGLGWRRRCRVLLSRGGGALRLSGRWILCRRRGAGL